VKSDAIIVIRKLGKNIIFIISNIVGYLVHGFKVVSMKQRQFFWRADVSPAGVCFRSSASGGWGHPPSKKPAVSFSPKWKKLNPSANGLLTNSSPNKNNVKKQEKTF